MRAAVAERAENGLRSGELPLERRDIAVGHLIGHQDAHLARAIGNRAEHQIEADRGDVEAFERNHSRRQAVAPAVREHGRASFARVVEDEAGVLAARLAIGR